MNQTVEKGKTLLVDGPALVVVTSGKVEVFGSAVNNTRKIVIREGKRLPFLVEEKATFDISSGENAHVEELDGSTIPNSWTSSLEELLKTQTKPNTVIVLGPVDSGKTSFCTYLINKLLDAKQVVAILDGDLGQSDAGPPCTLAYAIVTKPITDLFNLEAKNAFFVGVTSPSEAVDKVIEGLTSLKTEILSNNPDFLIVSTDGWVQGDDAIKYKIRLVEELNPNFTFCMQQNNDLTPLLNSLTKPYKIVESPSTIKQRSRDKRRNLRELGYVKYLRNAKVQSIPLSWLKFEEDDLFCLSQMHENTKYARKIYELLGMKPLHFAEFKDRICIIIGKNRWIEGDNIKKLEEFSKKKIVVNRKGEEEGLLMALYNGERKFLGIGILQEIDYFRKALKVLTPVSKEISVVALGRVKLDKNFKEIPAFIEEDQSELANVRKLF